MSLFIYKVDDTYPDIRGVITYKGDVDTNGMAVSLLANGSNSGPFTGPVVRYDGASNNPNFSTFHWYYYILPSDTTVEGEYVLELDVIHADGSKETINADVTVTVNA